MNDRMSALLTRPAIPVPRTWEMSTRCSCAIFRTSGDERWRFAELSADELVIGAADSCDDATATPTGRTSATGVVVTAGVARKPSA